MTERLDEHLRIAKIILTKLREKGPMRSEALKKAVLLDSPTMWNVQNTMRWMRRRGFIEKTGPMRSGNPYTITQRGIVFLEALNSA